MIPPDESIEQSHKHIFAYAFLEASIRGEGPRWSILNLGSNPCTLGTLPESIIPDLLPNRAGSSGDILQEGVCRQFRHTQEYLPYPMPEGRILHAWYVMSTS